MDGLVADNDLGYRLGFVEALRLLERAFALAEERGAQLPVIVGGAAVEYHTGGAIQSGDVDLAEGDEAIITGALLEVGFCRESRRGRLLRGFYYVGADFEIGVEFVSKPLFDGRTDRSRLELVSVSEEGRKVLRFPPIEDMIADRLGQYEEHPRDHIDMLVQAKILWRLADELDLAYLARRIEEEFGPAEWRRLLDEPDA
jgi:hypothetical protein